MLPNILFKVISNNTERQKMTVKFCRVNAPKPIENYESCSISYRNLDFSSSNALVESIRSVGSGIIMKQFLDEPILKENKNDSYIDSIDIEDYVGKLVSVSFNATEELNDVKL